MFSPDAYPFNRNLKLSKWFDWAEVTHSPTAERQEINNSLPPELRTAAINTAVSMDKVRETLGAPILVSSWYRCGLLNSCIGGATHSAHMRAEAVDFIAPRAGTPLQIAKILTLFVDVIAWDQLILEHTWIHIAFNSNPDVNPNRKQVLSLLSTGGYASGLVSKEGFPL